MPIWQKAALVHGINLQQSPFALDSLLGGGCSYSEATKLFWHEIGIAGLTWH
jgi:hypothetical protein